MKMKHFRVRGTKSFKDGGRIRTKIHWVDTMPELRNEVTTLLAAAAGPSFPPFQFQFRGPSPRLDKAADAHGKYLLRCCTPDVANY
jgi:hypothetical protein